VEPEAVAAGDETIVEGGVCACRGQGNAINRSAYMTADIEERRVMNESDPIIDDNAIATCERPIRAKIEYTMAKAADTDERKYEREGEIERAEMARRRCR
jgi:hypothetical protein